MSGTNEWDTDPTEVKEVSVRDMEAALLSLRAAKEEYEKVSKLSKEAHARMKEQETTVIKLLKESGQSSFIAEGVGRATVVERMSVKTPKGTDEKVAFFNWIKDNLGEEARDAYMTVNSATLNSLFKEQSELAAERGEVLQIDGLDEPTASSTLSFRKA